MPELPEVEAIICALRERTFRSSLSPVMKRIEIKRQNGRYLAEGEAAELEGKKIAWIRRLGKHVIFSLGAYGAIMVGHNAMSGFWDSEDSPWCFDYVEGRRKSLDSDVRLTIELDDGTILRYHDTRLFGSLQLRHQYPQVGPEALLTTCSMAKTQANSSDLRSASEKHPTWTAKQIMMDQKIVAGIGNIYATEALHAAFVNPSELGIYAPWSVILDCAQRIMQAQIPVINYGNLAVYRQKTCRCNGLIQKIEIAGRSTYFCPSCQPT